MRAAMCTLAHWLHMPVRCRQCIRCTRKRAGVLCVGLPAAECARLELPLMVPTAENEEEMYTAFTVTVDLREGVTTGISASDRCATIRALGSAATQAADLRKPGHIFPLIAREHGVLARPGHTEAAVDLARLAGARARRHLRPIVLGINSALQPAPLQRCIASGALEAPSIKHSDVGFVCCPGSGHVCVGQRGAVQGVSRRACSAKSWTQRRARWRRRRSCWPWRARRACAA